MQSWTMTPGTYPAAGAGWRSPYLAVSVLAHLALLGGLMAVGPGTPTQAASQAQRERIEASLQRTRVVELQQHVERLEAIRRELEEGGARRQPAGEDVPVQAGDPAALAARARQLSATIRDLDTGARAKALAALLHIPDAMARARLVAEAAKPAQANVLAPARRDIERQAEQAQAALQHARNEAARQRDGVRVRRGPGATPPADGQAPRMATEEGKQTGWAAAKGSGAGGSGDASRDKGGSAAPGAGLDGRHDGGPAGTAIPLPERLGAGAMPFGPSGTGFIPAVTGTLHKVRGATIGPGGEFGNRLLLDDWQVIGPFPGRRDRNYAANPAYAPERAVLLDAVYEGKGGRLLGWTSVKGGAYPLSPPVLAEDAVYYAYTEMRLDRDRDLWVWLGADDHARLWVNDELAYAGAPDDKQWFFAQAHGADQDRLTRDWNMTEARRLVHFHKGVNRLLLKLSNGPRHVFFSVVLTPA